MDTSKNRPNMNFLKEKYRETLKLCVPLGFKWLSFENGHWASYKSYELMIAGVRKRHLHFYSAPQSGTDAADRFLERIVRDQIIFKDIWTVLAIEYNMFTTDEKKISISHNIHGKTASVNFFAFASENDFLLFNMLYE